MATLVCVKRWVDSKKLRELNPPQGNIGFQSLRHLPLNEYLRLWWRLGKTTEFHNAQRTIPLLGRLGGPRVTIGYQGRGPEVKLGLVGIRSDLWQL